MDKDIGWEYLRSFLGVLQEGSLSAAALTRAAAGQGEGVQGVVRVTASEVIGVEVLPTILAALSEQHPRLKIELVLSNRMQDLLHREADIAVRMLRPRQTQLIARPVGQVELGLHATRAYLDRHGCPASLDALSDHTLIGFDRPTAFIRQAVKALPGIERDMFSLRSDSDLAQLALIRAGAGIGVCQVGLASHDKRLVRILPETFALPLDTWITMHEDLRHSPPCRVAFDALVVGLKDYTVQGTKEDGSV